MDIRARITLAAFAIPAALAVAGATMAANEVLTRPAIEAPDTWEAVVEWENGESYIVERGNLADCMDALDPFDSIEAAPVTYCERVTGEGV